MLSPILIWRVHDRNKIIPFWLKLNMTVKEASAYSGIGEKNTS